MIRLRLLARVPIYWNASVRGEAELRAPDGTDKSRGVVQGQSQPKTAAFPFLAFNAYAAAVLLDDRLANWQPQSGSSFKIDIFFFYLLKALEYSGLIANQICLAPDPKCAIRSNRRQFFLLRRSCFL